nr:hypothetical protein Iba_chr03bCG4750 [Ipomoea batatas]
MLTKVIGGRATSMAFSLLATRQRRHLLCSQCRTAQAEQRLRTSVRRQQRSGEASGKATSFPFHRWMGSPLGKGDGPTKRRERGLPGPDMVFSIETSLEMTSSSKTSYVLAVGSPSMASPLSRLSRISADVYFLMGKPEVGRATGAGKNFGTPVNPSVVVTGCEVGTVRIVTCEKLVPLDCHCVSSFVDGKRGLPL